jgi:hypothetical protein
MSSKEQTHNDRTSSKQRPPKPASENLDTLAQQQPHPATIIQRASRDPSSLTPRDVLQLQRTIGNQAVNRLLAGTFNRRRPAPAQLTVSEARNNRESSWLNRFSTPTGVIQRAIVTAPERVDTRAALTQAGGDENDMGATSDPANFVVPAFVVNTVTQGKDYYAT